jgi:TrmH family RNA methyltransferase
MLDITSTDNRRVKQAKKLCKARERKKQNAFLIEGAREVSLAAKNSVQFRDIFVCPEYMGEKIRDIVPEKHTYTTVSSAVFEELTYREEGSEGIVAVGEAYTRQLRERHPAENEMFLILDNVEKPGNLGALVRTASAVGVSAVVVNGMQTDILNPNVIRASLGAVFEVPVMKAEREETHTWLQTFNIPSYVTSARAQETGTVYWNVDFAHSFGLVLGSESQGISEFWTDNADRMLYIPMSHEAVSSLNVSISGAVMLFEAVRQRTTS